MADLMDVEVLGVKPLAPGCFEVDFSAPEVAGRARPGQFIHVLCGEGPGGDGLYRYLRRPFSLFRIDRRAGGVSVLFRVIGEGTRWLSGRKPGDLVSVIGPLGNGFPLPERAGGRRASMLVRPVLVGGGLGIPPLLPLAQGLSQSGPKPTVLLGARTAGELFGEDEFRAAGCEVEAVTDDGSRGAASVVTAPLEEVLSRDRPAGERVTVYACGPKPMLKAVQAMAARYLVPAYISVEERMACGVGACLGCPVVAVPGPGPVPVAPGASLQLPDREALAEGYRRVSLAGGADVVACRDVSYVRVCREGPVFSAWGVVI